MERLWWQFGGGHSYQSNAAAELTWNSPTSYRCSAASNRVHGSSRLRTRRSTGVSASIEERWRWSLLSREVSEDASRALK